MDDDAPTGLVRWAQAGLPELIDLSCAAVREREPRGLAELVGAAHAIRVGPATTRWRGQRPAD